MLLGESLIGPVAMLWQEPCNNGSNSAISFPVLRNPYDLPEVKNRSEAMQSKLDTLADRITKIHATEIEKLRKAIPEVREFQGIIGKL